MLQRRRSDPQGPALGVQKKLPGSPPPARHKGTFVECEHGPGPSGLKGPVLGDAQEGKKPPGTLVSPPGGKKAFLPAAAGHEGCLGGA